MKNRYLRIFPRHRLSISGWDVNPAGLGRLFGRLCRLAASVALFAAMGQVPAARGQAFVHPGLISTQADFDRMKADVAAGAHPMIDSYNILASNSHTSLSWTPNPQSIVYRGYDGTHPENYGALYNDIAAAYQDTLMWKITGNTAYADKAVQICNAWSSTLTAISGTGDKFLAAGIYGYEFACAAENLNGYADWTSADLTAFQNMMVNVFYPMNHSFLTNHNGACIDAYYANWDLCNMASVLAIGVLCDNRSLYNEALNYFYSGSGAGAIDHVVYQVFPDLTGQLQESGRDQGHSGLDIALLSAICQMAWSQGTDLFGYENNKFLSAAEYFAKYNLGNSVPYSNYENCGGVVLGAISSGSQGNVRPTWALVYNHYANLMGLACPYTAQYVAKVGVEGGGGNYGPNSGGYDQLGFTTLTCGLPPITGIQAPTGVIATVTGPNVQLAWWGATNATSYDVSRSTVSGGPYTTIASGVTTNTYTDSAIPGVTYYYVVQSEMSGTTSGYSTEISATPNTRITGTIIGTSGSYVGWIGSTQTGMTSAGAFDGNLDGANNFFDGPDANGDWAGLDVGAGYACVPTSVRYCPRTGFGSRMVGGVFQGSNTADFSSGVVTLYTITTAPPENVLTTATFSNTQAFRYLRYLSPNNGFCNVCEIQFWGTPAAEGKYALVNRNSGLVMDVAGQGMSNGTPVDQSQGVGQNNQHWTLTSVGDGQYQIMGVQSGKSLDVNGGSIGDGATVDISDYLNSPSQHFALMPTDSGYFRIAPVHSDMSIGISGGSTSSGADVLQLTWLGSLDQQWMFVGPPPAPSGLAAAVQ